MRTIHDPTVHASGRARRWPMVFAVAALLVAGCAPIEDDDTVEEPDDGDVAEADDQAPDDPDAAHELGEPGDFGIEQPDEGVAPADDEARLDEPLTVEPADAPDGEALYAANCMACHQADGSGADTGAILPLSGNPFVTADDPTPLAHVVMDGRGGMPSFGSALDDGELAELLTYLRQLGENEADEVAEDDVAEARDAARDGGSAGEREN